MQGSTAEKRHLHLLSWDVLCRPKDKEGAGLKRAELMNKALLAKFAWRMITQGDEAWCKIICSKYGVNDDGLAVFKSKQSSSLIW